jgi:hypothetical protein
MSETEKIEALAGDILRGAAAISAFLFDDEEDRRVVYNLAAKRNLPCFYMGQTLCARRSTLKAWIERQEAAHLEA